MKRADVLAIVGVAVVTFVVAISLSRTMGTATAGDVKVKNKAIPVLESGDVTCTLTLRKDDYKPGEKPVLVFKATNNGNSSEEVSATISMTSSAVPSPFARMMPMPETVWSGPCEAVLMPNETKVIDLSTTFVLKTGKQYQFMMKVGESQMTATQIILAAEIPSAIQATNVSNLSRVVESISSIAKLPGT